MTLRMKYILDVVTMVQGNNEDLLLDRVRRTEKCYKVFRSGPHDMATTFFIGISKSGTI